MAGFDVADLAAAVAWLASRGVQFERFAEFRHDEAGIWTAPDGAKVAWFRDPDKNLLSLVQYASTPMANDPPLEPAPWRKRA